MSKGSVGPMTCCDADCASVNGCAIGGVACDSCGRYFCGDEINEDGLCGDCAADREREEEEEETDND